jgi:hypothetical protein
LLTYYFDFYPLPVIEAAFAVFGASTITVTDTVFHGNRANFDGGAVVLSNEAHGIFSNNIFINNGALHHGGVMYMFTSSTAIFQNGNIFEKNHAWTLTYEHHATTLFRVDHSEDTNLPIAEMMKVSGTNSGQNANNNLLFPDNKAAPGKKMIFKILILLSKSTDDEQF